MPIGSLSRHRIISSVDGGLYFIPSGSATVGASQSLAVTQSITYTVTSSVAWQGTAVSGSNYYNADMSSSYWTFSTADEDKKQFYVYYHSSSIHSFTSNAMNPGPGGSGFAPYIQTGSYRIPVKIETGWSAAQVASASQDAINSSPLANNTVTATCSAATVTVSNIRGGAPYYNPFVTGSGLSFTISTSGSGAFAVSEYVGAPDSGSASSYLLLDPNDKTSFILSGSGTTKMYFSGSGRLGFGTTNPERDFDIRSDDFAIRIF